MPCHEFEEAMNASDDDQLRTPTKQTGNDGGAGQVEPDDELENEYD